MDERPDQILGHIEEQRDQLGRNLNELETRVREKTDWRTYFDRNPMMIMGAALGGGLLVGSMIAGKTGGKRRKHKNSQTSYRLTGDISGNRAVGSASTIGAASAGIASGGSTGYESQHSRPSRVKSAVSSLKQSESWHQVQDTVEDVKAALISFGVVKAKEFLSQAIPGIDHHLHEARSRRQGGGQSSSGQQHGSQHSGFGAADAGMGSSGAGSSGLTSEGNVGAGSHESGQTGHHAGQGTHLYTPTGEQTVRSGSWSSDPVGTYRP